MNSATIEFIEKALNANATKVDLADAVVDANQGQVIQAGIGALQVAVGLAETIAKISPVVGTGLSLASLGANVRLALQEYNGEMVDEGVPAGTIRSSTMLNATGDALSLLSSVALMTAGGAVLTGGAIALMAPALVTAAVIGATGAIAFTMASWMTDQSLNVDQLLSDIQETLQSLQENFGELYDQAVGLTTDAIEFVADGIDAVIDSLVNTAVDFSDFIGATINDIEQTVNDLFLAARNWIQRRDPLTLDLDGDGLETVGIDSTNPILFDHDGDGVKNATGWISPDDGFLVLDRNGNGEIDDGTELFGDSTPLLDADGNETGKAEDGFAALANQDSNGDGLVNNLDANWHDLRVWQDANSDGISQADELKTLEALDIAGIRVAKTENTTRLPNGNQIADLGTFIKTDGSENTLGNVTGNLADVDLADNPFFREFTDTLPLTPELQALPDMRGSGTVRQSSAVFNQLLLGFFEIPLAYLRLGCVRVPSSLA